MAALSFCVPRGFEHHPAPLPLPWQSPYLSWIIATQIWASPARRIASAARAAWPPSGARSTPNQI